MHAWWLAGETGGAGGRRQKAGYSRTQRGPSGDWLGVAGPPNQIEEEEDGRSGSTKPEECGSNARSQGRRQRACMMNEEAS